MTSPDRLARRFVHQILLIEEWERTGCQVEFLDRPMSQDPHDQLNPDSKKSGSAKKASGACAAVHTPGLGTASGGRVVIEPVQ